MKYRHVHTTGTAAKMMCPFKLAQKRSLKSVMCLFAGLPVILIDCIFSKHLLSFYVYNEPVFVILLAVSGISVLKDVFALKESFSTSQAFVLLRFSSIAACMLLTAAGLYISPVSVKYQVYIVLICSVFRWFNPSAKHFYVPVLFGTVVLIAAIIIMRTFFAGRYAVNPDVERIFPFCTTLVMTVRDYIVSRW